MSLDPTQRRVLHGVARGAIAAALAGRASDVDPARFDQGLAEPGASFVSLHVGDRLRGCVGTLEAHDPLVRDVARNARRSAFEDPRFPPLGHSERRRLDVQISVLSTPTPIRFSRVEELLAALVPGVDGLLIGRGDRRATFLPVVWASLPDPASFLARLKEKAAIPADVDAFDAWRYTTETF